MVWPFLFSGPCKKAHAPPRSLHPAAHSLIAAAVSYLRRSAGAPSAAPSPTRARHEGDAPSPTRARYEGDGDGARARALSDGGAVPGSAAASAAPPASRQSPRDLTSVLSTPAGDTAYAPPSPLPPPLDCRQRTAPAASPRAARGRWAERASSRCSTKGGRAALGALMPHSEALPVRLALQRAESCA